MGRLMDLAHSPTDEPSGYVRYAYTDRRIRVMRAEGNAMMRCQTCGQQLGPNDRFCVHCGTPCTPAQADSTSATVLSSVPPVPMPPVPVSEPAPPKKNHRGALIVGIVAAVVVVLAAVIFGVWWFVLRDDGTNGASTPSSSQTANQTDDDEKSDDVTDPDEEDDKPTKPVTCGIPDATLDTTSLEGDAMVAAFTFDSSACGDGEFSDDDVQVTIKDSDGDVVAAAVYDFSATPLKFSRGSATAELAFAIGQYWRPFDQIGTGADVVMQPDATSEGDSAAGTSTAMGGANIPSGDVERYSQLAMDWQRGHDRSAANAFYSTYTTQLSSKKYGMEIEGTTWHYTEMYNQFLRLRARHRNALLIWSGDYPTYTKNNTTDYYVILSGEGFGTTADATAWCSSNGYTSDDCLAVDLK